MVFGRSGTSSGDRTQRNPGNMKMASNNKRVFPWACAALVLGAWAWPQDGSASQPQAGASAAALPPVSVPFRWQADDRYVLHWDAHHRLEYSLFSIQRGDEEPDWATSLPSLETKEARTFQDWCQSVDSERPLRLRRRVQKGSLWGQLTFSMEGQRPLEVTMESPFTAPETTVQYTYVPEEQDYGRYYDRNAGGEHRLQDLRMDLDFAPWRPRGPVGTEWSLPIDSMRSLLSPGGELHYATAERGKQVLTRSLRMGFGGSWEPLLHNAPLEPGGEPSLKGKIDVLHEREADSPLGPESHLTFTFELQNAVDQSSLAYSARRRMEHLEGMQVQKALVGVVARGQGRLVWDAERGRLKGMKIDGQLTLSMDLEWVKGDEVPTREQTEYRGNFDVNAYLLPAQPGEEPAAWTTRPDPQEANPSDSK